MNDYANYSEKEQLIFNNFLIVLQFDPFHSFLLLRDTLRYNLLNLRFHFPFLCTSLLDFFGSCFSFRGR